MQISVRGDAPNQESISATLDDYEIVGIKWLPLTEFNSSFRANFYSTSDWNRVERLTEEIRKSGWVSPLIAVHDSQGYYILEGGHRLVALGNLQVSKLPALVVIDLEDPPKKRNPMSYPAMSYSAAHAYEARAKARGVSKVARGPNGFMRAYQRAGSFAKLPEKWKRKRIAFIKRHMAQVRQNNEQLWKDGYPSRRALALIMWAYMPPGRGSKTTKKNPSTVPAEKVARHFARTDETGDRDFVKQYQELIRDHPEWVLLEFSPPFDVDFNFYTERQLHRDYIDNFNKLPPAVVLDGFVIDGSHRFSAAHHLGRSVKAYVPVTQASRNNPGRGSKTRSNPGWMTREKIPQYPYLLLLHDTKRAEHIALRSDAEMSYLGTAENADLLDLKRGLEFDQYSRWVEKGDTKAWIAEIVAKLPSSKDTVRSNPSSSSQFIKVSQDVFSTFIRSLRYDLKEHGVDLKPSHKYSPNYDDYSDWIKEDMAARLSGGKGPPIDPDFLTNRPWHETTYSVEGTPVAREVWTMGKTGRSGKRVGEIHKSYVDKPPKAVRAPWMRNPTTPKITRIEAADVSTASAKKPRYSLGVHYASGAYRMPKGTMTRDELLSFAREHGVKEIQIVDWGKVVETIPVRSNPTKASRELKKRHGITAKRFRKIPGLGSKDVVITYLLADMPKSKPAAIREAERKLSQYTRAQLEKMLERKYQREGRGVSFRFYQSKTRQKSRYPWSFRISSTTYPAGFPYSLQGDWITLGIYGPDLPADASDEDLMRAAGVLAKKFGFTKRDYPKRYMQVLRPKDKQRDWLKIPWQQILDHKRRNPANPSRSEGMLLGALEELEVRRDGETRKLKTKGAYLGWIPQGKDLCILRKTAKRGTKVSASIKKLHREFHDAAPQSCQQYEWPDVVGKLEPVGRIVALTYRIPKGLKSPQKDQYLWHHEFGDHGERGHGTARGSGNYPEKYMPMLLIDEAGNLYIKRMKGNRYYVKKWLYW